jgi:hypothetical protein
VTEELQGEGAEDPFAIFDNQPGEGAPVSFSDDTKKRLLDLRDRQFAEVGALAKAIAKAEPSDVVTPRHLSLAVQNLAAAPRADNHETRLLVTGYLKGGGSALLAIGIPLLIATDPHNSALHPTSGWGLFCLIPGCVMLAFALAADFVTLRDRRSRRTRPATNPVTG